MPEEKKASPQIHGPIFSELGKTGLKESNGWVYEEFLPKLRWPRAGAVYQEMSSNDPVITAIMLTAKQLIKQVTWSVTAASTKRADVHAAEFVKTCMDDMNISWAGFIDELLSYFTYGFSYHEIVYKKRNGDNRDPKKRSKYNDNRIGWRKIPGRAQTTLHSWMFDDEGGIAGMRQQTSEGVVDIPINRALLFRTTAERNNPEGKSFLRGAYRPWYFKKHIEEVEGIGIERDLAGLPVVTAPEGIDLNNKDDPKAVDAKNSSLKLVSSIRRDRNDGVVLSSGWDLKLLSTGGTRQFDTNAIINRYDQRIAITMLADIVMLGADKVGSFALAKTKQSLLAAVLDAQLADILDIINSYAVPRLIALNSFPGITGMPKITCSAVVAPDLTELGNYIKALSGSQMPLFPDVDLENYLREVAKLPPVDESDESRQQTLERSKQQKASEGSNKKDDTKNPDDDKSQKGGEGDAGT